MWCAALLSLLGMPVAGIAENDDAKDASFPKLMLPFGKDSEATSAALSPDGRRVWIGTRDGEIALWDVPPNSDAHQIWSAPPQTPLNPGTSTHWKERFVPEGAFLVMMPDQRALLTAVYGNNVVTWTSILRDANTGAATRVYKRRVDGDGITALAVSSDGRRIAHGTSHGGVEVIDAATGEGTQKIRSRLYTAMVCFLKGDTDVLIADDALTVAKVASKDKVDIDILAPRLLACDADHGRYAVLDQAGALKLWVQSNASFDTAFDPPPGQATAAAFAADGERLVVGYQTGEMRILATRTGKALQSLTAHRASVALIAIARDAQRIFSAAEDGAKWMRDLAANRIIDIARPPNLPQRALALTADGLRLVTATDTRSTLAFDEWSDRFATRSEFASSKFKAVKLEESGKVAAIGDQSGVTTLWDVDNAKTIRAFPASGGAVTSLGLSEAHDVLVGSEAGQVTLWRLHVDEPVRRWKSQASPQVAISRFGNSVAFSSARDGESSAEPQSRWIRGDGTLSLVEGPAAGASFWSSAAPAKLGEIDTQGADGALVLAPDGSSLIAISDFPRRFWNIRTEDGKILGSGALNDLPIYYAEYLSNGTELAVAVPFGAYIVNMSTGSALKLRDAPWRVSDISTSPRFVAASGWDGSVRLWDLTGKPMATLGQVCRAFIVEEGWRCAKRNWIVTTPEGLYDSDSPGDLPAITWQLPSDPLTPYPVEAFLKDYFEPNLLRRILNGEPLREVRKLDTLNRVQPTVEILKVTQTDSKPEVSVVVQVSQGRRLMPDGTVAVTREARDVRLFRDGQLVASEKQDADKDAIRQSTREVIFEHVKLPVRRPPHSVEFTAYAFNEDGVKSLTARREFNKLPILVGQRKPRAILVSIGVDDFDAPGWKLKYAAADARLMQETLKARLERSGRFSRVVPVELMGTGEHRVTKARIRAVFDLLVGRTINSELRSGIPNSEQLIATPDDLVLISYSGHGLSDDDGEFYILPTDAKETPDSSLEGLDRGSLIAADEMSDWLREVDAGEIVLIIDACQSGAGIQDRSFRPAPLASRSLGQLAYDKGMRVLVAARAGDSAVESSRLKHGVLTYALLKEGLDARMADSAPQNDVITMREWLDYGARRVPGLYNDLAQGKFVPRGGTVHDDSEDGARSLISRQQPQFFDFRRAKDETVFKATP